MNKTIKLDIFTKDGYKDTINLNVDKNVKIDLKACEKRAWDKFIEQFEHEEEFDYEV